MDQAKVYDTLTGAFSRKHFDSRFQKELLNADKSGKPISVFFIDLDYFKSINDAYGHLRGDEILQAVQSRLTENLRDDHRHH